MHSLHDDIQTLISDPQRQATDADFIRLFQHQLSSNPAYAAFVKLQLNQPDEITHWQDIPALPTDAFKSSHNPSAFPLSEHSHITFLTSGTTTESKGAHHFRSTALYEASILSAWQSLQLPTLQPNTLILTPNAAEAPHSSLAHMMQTLRQEHCPSASFILSEGQINIDAFLHSISSDQPVSLIGTALAFLELFEALEEKQATDPNYSLPTLPKGSWAMETGGYKGTNKSLTKEELYTQFQRYLGIEPDQIWNEYSMTELSSQFYTSAIGNPHQGPHWTRIKVIDPETKQPVAPGELGYLVIYDLANIDSCLAILTQDIAIYHSPNSFTLIGRDPSALPRGCSRSLS